MHVTVLGKAGTSANETMGGKGPATAAAFGAEEPQMLRAKKAKRAFRHLYGVQKCAKVNTHNHTRVSFEDAYKCDRTRRRSESEAHVLASDTGGGRASRGSSRASSRLDGRVRGCPSYPLTGDR